MSQLDHGRADHHPHHQGQPFAASSPHSMDASFQDSPTIGRTQVLPLPGAQGYTANSPLPTPSSTASSRYGSAVPLLLPPSRPHAGPSPPLHFFLFCTSRSCVDETGRALFGMLCWLRWLLRTLSPIKAISHWALPVPDNTVFARPASALSCNHRLVLGTGVSTTDRIPSPV